MILNGHFYLVKEEIESGIPVYTYGYELDMPLPPVDTSMHTAIVTKYNRLTGERGWSFDLYEDWGLIPVTAPVLIAPPVPKTNFIEVPGADGSLDLTNYLAGRALYNNRSGSLEYYMDDRKFEHPEDYEKLDEMLQVLQGENLLINFEDDPNYYYIGRLVLNNAAYAKGIHKYAFDYVFEPYKLEVEGSLENPHVVEATVSTEEPDVDLGWLGMPTRLRIGADASGMTVSYNGKTATIPQGDPQAILNINAGSVVLTFTGSGNVTIVYDGGRL